MVPGLSDRLSADRGPKLVLIAKHLHLGNISVPGGVCGCFSRGTSACDTKVPSDSSTSQSCKKHESYASISSMDCCNAASVTSLADPMMAH